MKILIADDSELMRKRLRDSLIKAGTEIVGEASNGIDALQMISIYEPDFVILDIRMPGMNGIDVLRKIKEKGSKCKICVFSNYPYPQYKQKCFAEGADYFMDKNEDFNELINLVYKLSMINY